MIVLICEFFHDREQNAKTQEKKENKDESDET